MAAFNQTTFVTDEFLQGYRKKNIATTLITGPAREPISLDEIKQHLRISGNDDDSELIPLIQEARRYVEQMTGRAFISQTWDLKADRFIDPLFLPNAPTQSITSVTYRDLDGTTQTLNSSYYTLDSATEPARLVQAYGYSYPSTYPDLNSVTVRFVAGYGSDPSDVPERFKRAIKLYCQWQFDSDPDAKNILDMIAIQDKVQWF